MHSISAKSVSLPAPKFQIWRPSQRKVDIKSLQPEESPLSLQASPLQRALH